MFSFYFSLSVSSTLMKIESLNYNQEYIDSHYMEFCIPPKNNEVKSNENMVLKNAFC